MYIDLYCSIDRILDKLKDLINTILPFFLNYRLLFNDEYRRDDYTVGAYIYGSIIWTKQNTVINEGMGTNTIVNLYRDFIESFRFSIQVC